MAPSFSRIVVGDGEWARHVRSAFGGIGSMTLFRGSTTCPSSTVGRAASSYPPVAVTSGSPYSLLEGSAAGSESLSDLAEVEPTGRSLSGSMCSLASLATIKPLMVQAAMDSNTSLASPCLSRRPNDRRTCWDSLAMRKMHGLALLLVSKEGLRDGWGGSTDSVKMRSQQ